jgi:hypothetical protein
VEGSGLLCTDEDRASLRLREWDEISALGQSVTLSGLNERPLTASGADQTVSSEKCYYRTISLTYNHLDNSAKAGQFRSQTRRDAIRPKVPEV